jgi:hypothetical protein
MSEKFFGDCPLNCGCLQWQISNIWQHKDARSANVLPFGLHGSRHKKSPKNGMTGDPCPRNNGIPGMLCRLAWRKSAFFGALEPDENSCCSAGSRTE